MRKLQWLLVTAAVLLFVAADAQAQFPGGGFGRGGRGGGFGRGGGRRGGGGMRDPGASFDRMANGKTVLKRDDLNPWQQRMFDGVAKAAGVTNGELTKDQWIKGSQAAMAQWGRGGGGSFRGPGGGADQGKEAEAEFKKLDKNGDGKLNGDEMPKELASELSKYDTNKDGLIDQSEYTAYYKATHKDQGGDQSYGDIPIETEPANTKPVVYHAGSLPKEVQGTFQQYDSNNDGQISMYEWRKAGGSIEEFLAMDRNNDGLVTVEELLFYNAQKKANGGVTRGSAADTFTRNSGYNGGFGGRNGRSRRSRYGGGN